MSSATVFLLFVLFVTLGFIGSTYALIKTRQRITRFKGVVDAEAEAARISRDAQEAVEQIRAETAQLRVEYSEKLATFKRLKETAAIYEESADLLDMGFYKPHFSFESSERFKAAITKNKDSQKTLLRKKNHEGAIYCSTQWTVGGDKNEGKKMTTRAINLTARAFNAECDAAISACTFRNVNSMEKRIETAYQKLNELNAVNQIHITSQFLRLKLEELYLTYEYASKKQAEKEEQREMRAQIREEERAQREIEKAIREAEEEEKRAQRALEVARREMEEKLKTATAEQAAVYNAKIAQLEADLQDAESKGQRAISMAQQTKRGHVYVISNLGSFGENVFKIGMTRRLDPQDRVDELGSASVPFLFDVHAMIKSDNAPALEAALHQHFDGQRTNAVNRRKEFFNVSLEEVKQAVYQLAGDDVDFVESLTAQQYRETVAQRKAENQPAVVKTAPAANTVEDFAEAI